ncbi:MAG: gliding motility-associated C-terminal domain-containing protein [Flavobacteriales bacterium]|nr:gliding motility-associated C-terminal domain-containing protein [Flavobacteriales bacterium]
MVERYRTYLNWLHPPMLAMAMVLTIALVAQPGDWSWAHLHDHGAIESVRDIAVDQNTGAIYVVGQYDSNAASGPWGLPPSQGSTDAYLVKLDPSGNVLWRVGLGGDQWDAAYGVAIGPNGNVFITGTFRNTLIAGSLTPVPLPPVISLGGQDMFVASYNPDGDLLWLQKGGGPQSEIGWSVATNSTGVYVHGTFRGTAQFGNVTISPPNNGHDMIFLVKYPFGGGNPQWLRQGGGTSSSDDLAERIAATDGAVYIIGSFPSMQFHWRTPGGVLLNTLNAATPNDNAYITSFSDGGAVLWSRHIDDTGSHPNQHNGIAVDCGQVYIGGRCHNGAVFPGHGPVSMPGAHDLAYFAALDRNNGTTRWVRTARGVNDHGTEGFDIAVGPAGRVYMSGTFNGTLTLDDGRVWTAAAGGELFVAAFTRDGHLIWLRHESAQGDEYPLALATGPGAGLYVGGMFQQGISLPPFGQNVANNENIFLGRIDNPQWALVPDHSRWRWPGAICANAGPIDLNTYLRGHARATISAQGVINDHFALWAPDGNGALFNAADATMVLDLGDTIPAGYPISVTWRLANAGPPARANADFSLDGTTWTPAPTPLSTTLTSLGQQVVFTHAPARYLRISRSQAPPSASFLVDAVTCFVSTWQDGEWVGQQVTPAGMFDPSGLVGPVDIMYKAALGSCSYNSTHTIQVSEPPTGSITGPAQVCPGSNSGTITANGLPTGAYVAHWEASTDQVNWNLFAGETNVIPFTDLAQTTWFVAKIASPGCPAIQTAPHMVAVEDHAPPVIMDCPSDQTLYVPPNACLVPFTFPTVNASDDCGPTTFISGMLQLHADQAISPPPVDVTSTSTYSMPVGYHLLTEVFADASGNTTTCVYAITVIDTIPPVMTCPAPVTVNAIQATCADQVLVPLPLPTDNCGTVTVTQTGGPVNGSSFPIGEHQLVFLATDPSGNTASCSVSVSVLDVHAPSVNCPLWDGYPVYLDADCATPFPDLRDAITVTDCSPWTNTMVPSAGSVYTTDMLVNMTMWIEDAHGNGLWNNHIIHVVDTVAPVFACPANATIATTTCEGPVPDLVAQISDVFDCTGPVAFVQSPAPGTMLGGNTTVIITGTDAVGNSRSCLIPVILLLLDSDGDGTPDCTDPCPFDPDKTDPGICGCGTSDTDTDGDGIPDCVDDCPLQIGQVGSPCDDGNPSTGNDMVDLDCQCVGLPIDCSGVPGGSAYIDNCGDCVGETLGIEPCDQDCAGVWGGSAYTDNCGTCVGGNTGVSPCDQDCALVWGGSAFTDNCGSCVGGNTGLTPCDQDCADVWGGSAFTDNCGSCVGGTTGLTPCDQDCAGVWGGTAYTDNCNTCVGGITGLTPCDQDCAGVWGGSAFTDNCGTCVGGNTGLSPCDQDCAGVWGGTAFTDNCGSCVGGTTGLSPCDQDCAGVWGGTAYTDNCNTCVGGNTGLTPCDQDCAGVWGGSAFTDNCNTCVGGTTGLTPCDQDCAGVWGGTAFTDNCGTCVGGNTGLTPCDQDCAGVWGGTAFTDNCGTCVGGTTGLSPCDQDCAGVWGGSAYTDNCGTCVGGNTGLSPCDQDCADVWGGSAFTDNCGTCVGGNTGLSPCDQDCADVWGGSAFTDNCGSCVGGTTGLTPCDQDCAGVWGGTAYTDNCGTCVGGNTGLEACMQDCTGAWGGTAMPGTPCDDGLAATINDAWTNDCACEGEPVSCTSNAGPDAIICGLSHALQATMDDGTGQWTLPPGFSVQPSATQPNATVTAPVSGTYTLTWTITTENCTAIDQVVLTFIGPDDDLWVDAGPDQFLEVETWTRLEASASPGASFTWHLASGQAFLEDPNDPTSVVNGLGIGSNVFVLSASSDPCNTVSDTVLIHVADLFIPQGFSPNDDGVNDLFEITGMMAWPGSELLVFNRWGQQVYRNGDYANEWDGRSHNGRKLPEDTYFYVLNLNGGPAYKGHIILKR